MDADVFPASLQDVIRNRQAQAFVGRADAISRFQENLTLGLDDSLRRVIFGIDGQAGIGKSYLVRRLCAIAELSDCLVALSDDESDDVLRLIDAFVRRLRQHDPRGFRQTEKLIAKYWKQRTAIQADSAAPDGLASVLTNAGARIAIVAARSAPLVGELLDGIELDVAAEQVDAIRVFLANRLKRGGEAELLLNPVPSLSEAFCADLQEAATLVDNVVLAIDTFERRHAQIGRWLTAVLRGTHGSLPPNLILIVAGQYPLDVEMWGEFGGIIERVTLSEFTKDEVFQLFNQFASTTSTMVEAAMKITSGLPVLVGMLAQEHPSAIEDMPDPAETAIDRFLRWESVERRDTILKVAILRFFDASDLQKLFPTEDGRAILSSMAGLAFVQKVGRKWQFHQVIRRLMVRYLRDQSELRQTRLHAELVEFYSDQVIARDRMQQITQARESTNGDDAAMAEVVYHALCIGIKAAEHTAMSRLLQSLIKNLAGAKQFVQAVIDAGEDSGNDELSEFGQRLASYVEGPLGPADREELYTELVESGKLDDDLMVRALQSRAVYRIITLGKFELGIADCTKAIDIASQSAFAYALRARGLGALRKYELALSDVDTALGIDPSAIFAIETRISILRTTGELSAAENSLRTLIALNPAAPRVHANLATIELGRGNFTAAIVEYTKEISIESNQSASTKRAELLRFMQRYEESLSAYNELLRDNPDVLELRTRRAELLRLLGRPDEALPDAREGARNSALPGWGLFVYGLVLRDLDRLAEARNLFRRAAQRSAEALRQDPTAIAALFNGAMAWSAVGRADRARILIRRMEAIGLDPEHRLQATILHRELCNVGIAEEIQLTPSAVSTSID